MKILTADQLRAADAYTIEHEPIASIDLMERAATTLFNWIMKHYKRPRRFAIFCGQGNNGGDGLVLARLLQETWHEVNVYVVVFAEQGSSDFELNRERTKQLEIPIQALQNREPLPALATEEVVIDAIFGTGLNRPAGGHVAKVIGHINDSGCEVIAVDTPSGLMTDGPMVPAGPVVKARYTLTFQAPKLAFVLPEWGQYVGRWEVLKIGLYASFIKELKTKHFVISDAIIQQLLRPRYKFSHKGTYGHALLVAGQFGMMGAALLSAKATLRSGVGLLTAHVPQAGLNILQQALPEAIVSADEDEHIITNVQLQAAHRCIEVGPGIGTHARTAQALKLLIQNAKVPLVLDADALNILSENKTWLAFLPKGSVLTPHPKELGRLIGSAAHDYDRLDKVKTFAIKHQVYVLIKGAHTAVVCPDGEIYFNNTGNPGMATAGSGDVLCGVITALIAQGYSSFHACLLGVYVHGAAGDLAAAQLGMAGLIASDIVETLPAAFAKWGL